MARLDEDGNIYFDDDQSPEENEAFFKEEAMAEATLQRTIAYKMLRACGYPDEAEPGKGSRLLDRLANMAEKAGLLDASGSILISSEATLERGRSDIYFLGLNPGGAVDDAEPDIGFPSVFQSLALSRLGVSGWDQDWSRKETTYAPGGSPMQKRFKHIAQRLGLAYGDILATNLVFARSRRLNELSDFGQEIERSLPIHTAILDAFQPKRLWVMGNIANAGKALRLHPGSEWERAGYGNWYIGRGTVDFCGHTMQLCHTPHLSFWDADAPDKQDLIDFAFTDSVKQYP